MAKELKLDWRTIKALEKQCMCEQLKRAGTPGPKAIGIDEISVRKRHTYRIVVSDRVRKRPIWFGGQLGFVEGINNKIRVVRMVCVMKSTCGSRS